MTRKKKHQRQVVRKVNLSREQIRDAIRNTPIRHKSLEPDQLILARYTYEIAGRFVQPTLEQWELGFMKDTHPRQELAFWVIVSDAFSAWCKDNPAATDQDKRVMVGMLTVADHRNRAAPHCQRFLDEAKRRLPPAEKTYMETIRRLLTQEADRDG